MRIHGNEYDVLIEISTRTYQSVCAHSLMQVHVLTRICTIYLYLVYQITSFTVYLAGPKALAISLDFDGGDLCGECCMM